MIPRTLLGSVIGAAWGAAIGAAGFAVSESLFGRGIGLFGKSPLLAAVIGVVVAAVPSAVAGAVVAAFRLGKLQAAMAGAVIGVVTICLFLMRGDRRYFYESGYFDRQFFFYDLALGATLLLGLACVSVVVSEWAARSRKPGRAKLPAI